MVHETEMDLDVTHTIDTQVLLQEESLNLYEDVEALRTEEVKPDHFERRLEKGGKGKETWSDFLTKFQKPKKNKWAT